MGWREIGIANDLLTAMFANRQTKFVDDFFNDPEALVDFGKSLPKEVSSDGRWPGKRSKQLWEIDEVLHNTIVLKILNCYYDLDYLDISWSSAKTGFQEIPRFSKNKNDIRNKGWIHQDTDLITGQKVELKLAGLIYLTPNIDLDSGTSLFDVKSNKRRYLPPQQKGSRHDQDPLIHKHLLYKSGQFDREKYEKDYIKLEENYFEKIRFQNIFNRLIMYDTSEWHRANSYWNGDGKDARLHLGFFIGGISGNYPLERVKNDEYESLIKLCLTSK